MSRIRAAALAGSFYPADPTELTQNVNSRLADAETRFDMDAIQSKPAPKAIVAPHAGYMYSGDIAASAYTQIKHARDTITRVVLLGPCHHVAVRGLALCSADEFETPLGRIPVDMEACQRLSQLPQVSIVDDTHVQEHSLEVHLPFLQITLGDFELIPLIVGHAAPQEVAQVLELVWGGPETLIVVSSDLSHYLDYKTCTKTDARTTDIIESLNYTGLSDDQACGRYPLKGLMAVARRRAMKVTTLDVRNSGDTAGNKDRVVGYGAWMFEDPAHGSAVEDQGARTLAAFTDQTRSIIKDHGEMMLKISAYSIRYGVSHGKPFEPGLSQLPKALQENGASFITLNADNYLRGCIGSFQAHRPLAIDIAENAYKAAFKDPRFSPVKAEELAGISMHISVLSPPMAMSLLNERDLLDQLRPEIDGLIIEDQGKRALFLPSVWEGLPDKREFLRQLKTKAGLHPDHWSEGFRAYRFITEGVNISSILDIT